MKTILNCVALAGICIAAAACQPSETTVEIPPALAMTEEAVGHYCNMNILEHTGPKAQIHLAGMEHAIWFSQVRDAVAFTRSPEEHFKPIVIYVNDMGKAADWDFPGDDTWIDAAEAHFVINSQKVGGMGAPEVIPFGTEVAADDFIASHGGERVSLADVPDDYVLGPVDLHAGHGPIKSITQ